MICQVSSPPLLHEENENVTSAVVVIAVLRVNSHTGKCIRLFGGIYAYCVELDHFQVIGRHMAIYVSI